MIKYEIMNKKIIKNEIMNDSLIEMINENY